MKVLIVIGDIDLSCIPVQNLASLVACVRFSVSIENVRGCDLLKLLESVRSSRLNIYRQSLDTEETKTLVKALETNLENLAQNPLLVLSCFWNNRGHPLKAIHEAKQTCFEF